jgi:hypothetical protein
MGVTPVSVEFFVREGIGFREEDGEFCDFGRHGCGRSVIGFVKDLVELPIRERY